MATPFDKVFAPDADIDLSLFSHIHNDPFLAGTFTLEGNYFQRTTRYLDRYCTMLGAAGKPLPREILALQARMQKVVEVEADRRRIQTMAATGAKSDAERALKKLSESLSTDLLDRLRVNEYLSLPGGWDSTGTGHSMVYQFKRTLTGIEFYIHNAGAGIEYHQRHSATDRELYYPVQAYQIPMPVERNKLSAFLRDLMLPQMKELREAKDRAFDEKKLYEDVLPRINFLNARLIPVEGEAEHAFTAGQLSGTCSQRSLHQMLKQNFKTLDEYQRFIYQFKRFALDDYMRGLQSSGQIGDRRVQVLVRRAINTMLRTLNVPGVFADDFIASQRRELLAYRALLARARVNSVLPPLAPVVAADPKIRFALGVLQATLHPAIVQPVVVAPLVVSPAGSVTGGGDLVAQLQLFNRECDELKRTGQQTVIIERLESLFTNMPLPATKDSFNDRIPFYSGLHGGNEAEFYAVIAALQTAYLDACKAINGGAPLPRQLVVGLSIVSMLDYVSNIELLRRNKLGMASNHDAVNVVMGRFTSKNRNNPFYATNDPILDARLKSILSLYPDGGYLDVIEYYAGIVNSEEAVKAQLLARYVPPADAKLARLLREKNYQELYCLTKNFDALSRDPIFEPLIKKFNKQGIVEQCILKGMQPFWGDGASLAQRIVIEVSGENLDARSVLFNTMWNNHTRGLLTHKYGLSESLPAQRALAIDYADAGASDGYAKARSDNHTQLYPAEVAKVRVSDIATTMKSTLAGRQIDKIEIASREFFHLRASVQNQIKLTLDYFQQHLSKLSDRACQVYMEANLFEPGLLAAELDKNPELLDKIDHFIDEGLKQFSERGCTSQHSLFFIRLAYLVNQYAAKHNPAMGYARLDKLQQRLTSLLQIDEKNDVSIKQTLHQYQFLTAMARLKLNPIMVKMDEILALALPSYFYMNANSNPQAFVDTASRFDLECVKHDFKLLVSLAHPRRVAQLAGLALETVGLGKWVGEPTKPGSLYHVTMQQGDQRAVYRVDVVRGLIFNDRGMAFSPVPLDIINHPVMRYLNINKLNPCFTSSDGLCFEMGVPTLRFIRRTKDSQYRVQKEWTVAGRTEWYELNALSVEQATAFRLEAWNYNFLEIPDILKQRNNQIWINCEQEQTFIITDKNQPVYSYSDIRTLQRIKQLDATSHETGFDLCLGKTWLHTQFAKFEDAGFITVCQNADNYQVNFGRYGFTLLVSKELGQWVYRLQNEPAYTLVGDAETLIAGVAGFVFEDKISKQRLCYLPVQQFTAKNELSERSEFYNLQQDTVARIPKHVVQKLAAQGVAAGALPWQYSDSERVIRYQLDKEGALRPETPCDALYLCYALLGSQQPEKAWDVLEDCAKRLGGLKGTVEELQLLSWIIHALPRTLEDEDSKAVISTPAYVACQLKALALLTGAFTPDKAISFPQKTFDLKTPDGIYQDKCWKELKVFHAGLNETIYLTYTRFQSMQRHIEHEFRLKDNEKKSLLDYYHFHLPGDDPKALGALGYEWHVLGLKALRKEYEALGAEEVAKGRLPVGYQKRLAEIQAYLSKQLNVRKHHSELVLLPIDLRIPDSFKAPTVQYSNSVYQRILPWMEDISKCPLVSAADLQAALTPDMTEEQLYQYFPHYLKLVLMVNPLGAERVYQTALIDFCRQYLMAHRFTPLDKQGNKVAYLCNILLRISQNRGTVTGWNFKRLVDIVYNAQNLPDPEIKIYQVRDTTDKLLASTRQIWDDLERDVPTPGRPMVAAPYLPVVDYSFENLMAKCAFHPVITSALLQVGEQYRAQAKIFGQPPAIPAPDEANLMSLSRAEREAGKEQVLALQAMKNIASEMLADQTAREKIASVAETFMSDIGREGRRQLDVILDLANTGPSHPLHKRHRDLEVEGNVRARLDEQQLLALYHGADRARYALETGLNDGQIQELHTKISHYLALSIRQQSLQRLISKLSSIVLPLDPSVLHQVANELLTVDGIDHQTDPALAVLQYNHNILLRPQQIGAIKDLLTPATTDPFSYHEEIKKIIMGGGKSKEILPAKAKKTATGTNLVVIEVPRALFETNCADLALTSGLLYNQKACPFEFNRDSDCSPEGLQFIYSKLIDVIVGKDYLVTTGDAIQSLELKYLELVLQPPEDAGQRKKWASQVEWLDKIVSLFRTRADVVMDEVHQALLLKKKLNYTLGDRRAVSTSIITECVELYRFFDQVSLTALGDGFAEKTLASILENHQLMMELMTDSSHWEAALSQLTSALVNHPKSPLKQTLQRLGLRPVERDELINYLSNKGPRIPDCILRCEDPKIRTICALYKEQASELLSQTLKRKLNVNYGASHLRPGEGLAIPYETNNKPLERSRFGNYLESINFSIQMLMIDGAKPELLKRYLNQLQVLARQELLKDSSVGMIDNTDTARGFFALAPMLGLTLSQIRLDDDEQFKVIFAKLRRNKSLLCEMLKADVLPQIHVESQILHSDAYNHVDIYRSAQGVTGTPSNSSTYHQRLSYHKNTAAATDGFILGLLESKGTAIRPVGHTSTPQELLAQLFAGKVAGESVRAIIDICASFRGISNIEVATSIAAYARLYPGTFSEPSALQYIMFFNEDNRLCALGVDEGSKPVVIGSTDPEVINAKLGCTPDARFNYYDQEHTLGVDLKLPRCAKGLALVDRETTLEKAFQGFLREREFQDGQQIEIIVPASMADTTLDVLIAQFAENEERQLQQDNFSAAQAKMTNIIRADFMKRLLALPGDAVDEKHRYATAFKDYFVQQANNDFFGLYGGLAVMRGAQDILEEQRERMLLDWSATLRGLGEPVDVAAPIQLRKNLDHIITCALPFCQKTYLSPTRQEHGKEVEVQKQVQVELQRETQLVREVFNPALEPQPYQSWWHGELGLEPYTTYNWGRGFRSLTELCRLNVPNAPDFGEIYASPNYYQTYKGQTQLLGVFLKPVHALLFRVRRDGKLDCLIVSQQEAEQLTTEINKYPNPSIWLSTTQNTVLAGRAPGGINDNVAYQELIEKVRFFNGEHQLLLSGDMPLNWLSEESGKKLSFFEQNLLQYRETEHKEMLTLRQALSQRQKAFRYIAEHPLENYAAFEWRVHVSDDLTDADIEECERLAAAFLYANTHWRDRDFTREKCVEGHRLSLQAIAYINRYYDDQLVLLRRFVPLDEVGPVEEMKAVVDSLLPMLIKDFIPGVRSKNQMLLEFILKKASSELNNEVFIHVAEWLLTKGARISDVNVEGRNALELVIQGAGDYVLVPVRWLLAKGVRPVIDSSVWVNVAPETLDALAQLPEFSGNEPFILAYIDAFKANEEKLTNIVRALGQSPLVLKRVIAVMVNPTKPFLNILLANSQVRTDAVLATQLLEKVVGEARKWALSQLVSSASLSPEVLVVVIEKSRPAPVEFYNTIFESNRTKLRAEHLSAMMKGLPREFSEAPSPMLLTLVQSILNHQQVNADVYDAVVDYALNKDVRLMDEFWNIFLAIYPWAVLKNTTLQRMVLNLPDGLMSVLLQTDQFRRHQDDIVIKLLNSANPALYQKLLTNKLLKLEPKHFISFLSTGVDAQLLQPVLPQIAAYTSANPAVLQMIISVMVEPAVELLKVLLANPKFTTNSELVLQCLEKVGADTRQIIITDLVERSELDASLLSVIIQYYRKYTPHDLNILRLIVERHAAKLTAAHLERMLSHLKNDGLPIHFQTDAAQILNRIMKHPAGSEVVLGVVSYALLFEKKYQEGFWIDGISRLRWDTLSASQLTHLFLELSKPIVDHLLQSKVYGEHKAIIVDKLINGLNVDVYRMLLTHDHVALSSSQLLQMITRLDVAQVQILLPLIVNQPTADLDIFKKVIEVMTEPADELLGLLLENELFTSSDALITPLLDKLKPATRRRFVAELSNLSKSQMESDVLNVVIKEGEEEGKEEVRRFTELMDKHDSNLLAYHFRTMLKRLSTPGAVRYPDRALNELLCRMVSSNHATRLVQQEAVLMALKFDKGSMNSFWTQLNTLWWMDFDVYSLFEMFQKLPPEVIDSLLRSEAYTADPDKLIKKFIQSDELEIQRMLLTFKKIEIKPQHLISIISKLEGGPLQALLPEIAAHPAVDQAVLNRIFDVMVLPASELMAALLACNQLIADVSLVSRLWGIFAPISGATAPRWEAMQLLKRVAAASEKALDTAVLESAVLYLLQFDAEQLRWVMREMSRQRWDKFADGTLREMLLKLMDDDLNQLMLYPVFTENREEFISKFILIGDVEIYPVLLKSPNIGLQANHLTRILDNLDLESARQLLQKVALHPAVDRAVLQQIIIRMPEPPTDDLLRALLGNDIFKTDAPLLLQLLEKVGTDLGQWVITELTSKPGLSEDVLALLILKNSTLNFEGYRNILMNYSAKIRETHLSAMVLAIASPENTSPVPPVTLMQEIMKHRWANKSVLTDMINYAIKFEPHLLDDFWQDISQMAWNTLDAETLQPMFIALSGDTLELFLRSETYRKNRATIIWTVTQNPGVAIYSQLLNSVNASLRAEDLDTFMLSLERMDVQALLPQFAQHAAADQSICNRIIELVDAPTVELLLALLSNYQFSMTVEIIDRFAKCGDPEIYQILLESDRIVLEARHLLGFIATLDPHTAVQSLLPDIAGYVSADEAVLQAVIDVVREPTDLLLSALLKNQQFVTNAGLVRQLLDKLSEERRQAFISRLVLIPAIGSDVLTVVIEKNDPLYLGTYGSVVDRHITKLFGEQLQAIVQAVSASISPRNAIEAIRIMQCVVNHEASWPVTRTQAVRFVLPFGEVLAHDFMQALSDGSWNHFGPETLAEIFSVMPGQMDTFIRSRAFRYHGDSVINKLIESRSHHIYRQLLNKPAVGLESDHLLRFLSETDLGTEHALLVQIAGHNAADLQVLQQVIEVMREPTDELLRLFLARAIFINNAELVKALLKKVDGNQFDWIIAQLLIDPDISAGVVQIIIEENKVHVNRLVTLFEQQRRNLSQEQLITLLPSGEQQINAWRGQPLDAAKLLKAILQHEQADDVVIKAVMACALKVIASGSPFWKTIPHKVDKVDFSGNKLGNKLDDDLKKIFESLTGVAEVDLSNNNLGEKDKEKLAAILATLPPSVRKLNLTGNGIDATAMPFIMAAIPQSVATIAYEQNRYMPRNEVNAQFTDHSFLLNCLASIALVAGAAMLIVGLVALHPILIGVGVAVVSTVIGGAFLGRYGMFSSKPPHHPEEAPLLGPVVASAG